MAPGRSSLGKFRESVLLGTTHLRVADIMRILHRMSGVWLGPDYSIVGMNCITFSKMFLGELSSSQSSSSSKLLHLPSYAVSMSDWVSSSHSLGRPSIPVDENLVIGSVEKMQMWKEAERIMLEREEAENGIIHSYLELPVILHGKNLPLNSSHTYTESLSICQSRLHGIRDSRRLAYMRAPGTRRLVNSR